MPRSPQCYKTFSGHTWYVDRGAICFEQLMMDLELDATDLRKMQEKLETTEPAPPLPTEY